jgi:hypothetical protein
MCLPILYVGQKCSRCGFPLTNDEIDRHLERDGFKDLCFKCDNELY